MIEKNGTVFDPSPEIVNQINGLVLPQLDPKSPDRVKLEASAKQFHVYYQDLENLLIRRTGLLRWPTRGLFLAQGIVDQETLQLSQARSNLQHTSSDLDLVSYRVLQRLHAVSASQMPLWMVILRSVTRVPENPLQSFEAAVEKDKGRLGHAKGRLENVQKRVAEDIDPEVRKSRDELGRLRKGLAGIWNPVIIPSRDLTGQYVRIWPSQAKDISMAYARAHVEEESRGEKVKVVERATRIKYPVDSASPRFVRNKYIEFLADEALAEWMATTS